MLHGIQTAVLANHSFNSPKKPYAPFDFMPSKQAEKQRNAPKPKRFNRQSFANEIRTAMGMLPAGRVVTTKAEEPPEVK